MADSLTDLEVNEDRQVHLGQDNDLSTVTGIDTVKQSLALNAGDVLRPLIGEPIQDSTFADAEAEITERLQEDPQVEGPDRVDITRVNTSTGTVFVEVFTSYNESFEIGVTP